MPHEPIPPDVLPARVEEALQIRADHFASLGCPYPEPLMLYEAPALPVDLCWVRYWRVVPNMPGGVRPVDLLYHVHRPYAEAVGLKPGTPGLAVVSEWMAYQLDMVHPYGRYTGWVLGVDEGCYRTMDDAVRAWCKQADDFAEKLAAEHRAAVLNWTRANETLRRVRGEA